MNLKKKGKEGKVSENTSFSSVIWMYSKSFSVKEWMTKHIDMQETLLFKHQTSTVKVTNILNHTDVDKNQGRNRFFINNSLS